MESFPKWKCSRKLLSPVLMSLCGLILCNLVVCSYKACLVKAIDILKHKVDFNAVLHLCSTHIHCTCIISHNMHGSQLFQQFNCMELFPYNLHMFHVLVQFNPLHDCTCIFLCPCMIMNTKTKEDTRLYQG